MTRKALTGVILLSGIVAGIGLVELGLRNFMPSLLTYPQAEKGYLPADSLVYAPNKAMVLKPHQQTDAEKITFNQYGYRDVKDIANSNPEDWVVFGGSLAFGIGTPWPVWFGNQYEYEKDANAEVYNASFIGGSNYFVPMQRHAEASGAKAERAVFVIDLAQHPEVLLAQEQRLDAEQNFDHTPGAGFFQRLALARALGTAQAPQQDTPKPIDAALASRIAMAIQPAIAPYAVQKELAIVVVVPARGYWLENAHGTVHRQNQENVARAFRSLRNVYAVDLSYMMRKSYANPLKLYHDNGRLKPEAHAVLAEGMTRQVEVFKEWKHFDELSPAEQEKVKKQMEENARKREEQRRKNIFE